MGSEKQARLSTAKITILVTLIGSLFTLAGALGAAVISNWDKIFRGGGTVIADYKGYEPSNDWETEVETYFRASGWCKLFELSQEEFAKELERRLRCNTEKFPATQNPISIAFSKSKNERITCKNFVERMIDVYKGRYDIEQMHELNRFYHTDVMKKLVTSKMEGIAKDSAKIQAELLEEFQNKILNDLNKDNEKLPSGMQVFIPPGCS